MEPFHVRRWLAAVAGVPASELEIAAERHAAEAVHLAYWRGGRPFAVVLIGGPGDAGPNVVRIVAAEWGEEEGATTRLRGDVELLP
jgi:hypothetical protein